MINIDKNKVFIKKVKYTWEVNFYEMKSKYKFVFYVWLLKEIRQGIITFTRSTKRVYVDSQRPYYVIL